jgi:glycerate kinase
VPNKEETSKKQIPTFAIVGSVGNGADKAYEMGLNGIYSLIDTPSSLEEILKNSQTLYAKTAESLFRTIKSLTK